jgi:hypothetical protein
MTLINFWLDALLFVAVASVVWISLILWFVFPAPTKAAGWSLWGLTYDQWYTAQFVALCIAAALTLEHVVLHWNWVCTVLATRVLRRKRPDEANQAVYGVGTFIGILLLVKASLIAALLSVQEPSSAPTQRLTKPTSRGR